jgi:hypothetical protein
VNLRRPALLASLPLLASLSLPLTGCYGDEEAFAKTTAKHSCKRLRECDKSQFDDMYGGDLQRCRDEQYTDFLDAADIAADFNCEYDSDQGQACGSTVRELKTDCSDDADRDIVDACEEVFDCPGLLQLDPPPTGPAALVLESLASWPEDGPSRP